MRHRNRMFGAALFAFMLASTPAFALGEAAGFEAGQTILSLGAGPSGSSALYGTSAFWFGSGEVGVNDQLSVGGFFGATGSRGSLAGSSIALPFSIGYTVYGARASYHFTDLLDEPRLDLYAGGSLGRQSLKVTLGDEATDITSLAGASWVYGAHAGARYFFTPTLGGFAETAWFTSQTAGGSSAEVTYGPGNISVGLTLKF